VLAQIDFKPLLFFNVRKTVESKCFVYHMTFGENITYSLGCFILTDIGPNLGLIELGRGI